MVGRVVLNAPPLIRLHQYHRRRRSLDRNFEPGRHINAADNRSFSETAITTTHDSPESHVSQTSTRHVAENSFGRDG